jgi:hypothetical protein
VTVRFAKTLIAVLLAMSQVVGSAPLQANFCGAEAECRCSHVLKSCRCCCCHRQARESRSCCHSSKTVEHKSETERPSLHYICGCGCQQTSQQEAPLSPPNHSYELNPRICFSSLDEVVPTDSDSVFPSARGTYESHAFYAELPQELLFCSWLI